MRLTALMRRVPFSASRVMLNKPGRRARAGELEEALDRHAELADEVAEVRDHQVVAERIVTGSHGRMSSEHAVGGNGLQRRVERQPLRQVLAQQLQNQERGMTLVQMPHGRA